MLLCSATISLKNFWIHRSDVSYFFSNFRCVLKYPSSFFHLLMREMEYIHEITSFANPYEIRHWTCFLGHNRSTLDNEMLELNVLFIEYAIKAICRLQSLFFSRTSTSHQDVQTSTTSNICVIYIEKEARHVTIESWFFSRTNYQLFINIHVWENAFVIKCEMMKK